MTDKYGRSFIFKKTIYLTCISAVVLILCNSFWQIVVSCFFLGLGIGGDIAIPPSVFIESIAPSMRARATLMNMGYCIGPVISSICMQCSVLWWVGPFAEWKFFLCIIAAITVIVAIVRDDMLESPIYLYRSRDSNFHLVIREMAQSNGRSSYDDIRVPFLARDSIDEQRSYGLQDVFAGVYCKISSVLSVSLCIFTFALYGIILFEPILLDSLAPNEQYYIQVSNQAFGMLGLLVSSYLVDSRLGRKYSTVISTFATGVMCFVVVSSPWPPLVLAFITGLLRFFQLIAIASKNLITSESYPPQFRGLGVGFLFTITRFTTIFSGTALGVLKENYGNSETMYMLCGAYLLASILFLLLTETKIRHIN